PHYSKRMGESTLKSHNRGVTLIELVVTIGIAGILLAIAVPSYRYVTSANRAAAEINNLLGDVQYARSEAIKEGLFITLCPSTDQATCATSTTNWATGWIVFTDVNNNQTVDTGEQVLRITKALGGTDTLTSATGLNSVTFNREGFAVSLPSNPKFTL